MCDVISYDRGCDVIVFFFPSRRRHTRLQDDWSSDVCSSDLLEFTAAEKAAVGYDEMPAVYFSVEINYATVHKEREQGRVVQVEARVVLGSAKQVKAVLAECDTAQSINVSYVERSHGTQRHFNARKARKVYTF